MRRPCGWDEPHLIQRILLARGFRKQQMPDVNRIERAAEESEPQDVLA